jgi:hypothetical protein
MVWSIWAQGARAALVLLMAWAAWRAGAAPQLLMAILVVGVPVTLVLRAWQGSQGQVEKELWRHPLQARFRGAWALWALRTAFFSLCAWALASTLLPWAMDAQSLTQMQRTVWGSALLHSVLALFPHKKTGWVTPALLGVGTLVVGWQVFLMRTPQHPSQAVVLGAPLAGRWHVLMGGPSVLTHPWGATPSLTHAVDLVHVKDGALMPQGTPTLQAFPSFGQPVLAPADGVVVRVENAQPDPIPGAAPPPAGVSPLGNHVVLRLAGQPAQHVVLAHLQSGSVEVAVDQVVQRGQRVARVGNSGAAGVPSLQVNVLNTPDLLAEGARSLPWTLEGPALRQGVEVTGAWLQRGDVVDFPLEPLPGT